MRKLYLQDPSILGFRNINRFTDRHFETSDNFVSFSLQTHKKIKFKIHTHIVTPLLYYILSFYKIWFI